MIKMFEALWRYRTFVLGAIRNEFVSTLKRSRLGFFWLIAQPLALVLIYALILSNVLSAKLPGVEGSYGYAIYLMAGLLGWLLFSELVSRGTGLFIASGDLMKKMSFPRITLPAITLGVCLVQNLFLFVAMISVFLALGHAFSAAMFWLLVLVILVAGFGLGVGLFLGVLNVFIRDVGQFVPILLQFAFWFTPILYPVTIIPEPYQGLFDFNVLYWFVASYQNVIVYGQAPEAAHLLGLVLLNVLLLGASLALFRRASPEMVDVL